LIRSLLPLSPLSPRRLGPRSTPRPDRGL